MAKKKADDTNKDFDVIDGIVAGVNDNIKTKLIEIEIRNYILKRTKEKLPDIGVAMVTADITVERKGKLEKFRVQTPLGDDVELSRCIKALVSQAIQLKYSNAT